MMRADLLYEKMMRTIFAVGMFLLMSAASGVAQEPELAFRPDESLGLSKQVIDLEGLQQCKSMEQKYPPTGFLGFFFSEKASIRIQECFADMDRQHKVIVISYFDRDAELVGPIAFIDAFWNAEADEYEPRQAILNRGAEEDGRINKEWYGIFVNIEATLREKTPGTFKKLVQTYK